MICWYCHWGWSKQVVDIYNKYIDTAGEPAMHCGPGHIVWDDENFERVNVQWSLDNFDKHEYSTDEENEAVRQSLIELLKLPDNILDPEPKDYDGEHPENFPPTIEMVKK